MDTKTALQKTLTEKQELVRNYQDFAREMNDQEISKMYKHFAEAEALHATQIKDKLEELS
ncbi:MAG: rubrerythrin family protein [Pelosinus sp.]|nr:rubrerythrin family protein [Pelosinus sp.]